MFEDYKNKPLITGFHEPVESKGMKLSDDYFVTIDIDMLDSISRIQQETDPDTYKAKWGKKIGEKLFLYMEYNGPIYSRVEPVSLDDLSHYINKREIGDMRLADKDTLTRTAARQVAEIMYYGEGSFYDSSIYAAIGMILFIRNGYNKKDFWNSFKKELRLGLEELLESNGSLEIEEQLVYNPFHEEDDTNMDITDKAKQDTEYYHDKNLVVFDSEIAEIIKKNEGYSDDTINHALGQYVIIAEDSCDPGMSKEEILKDRFPSLLTMISLDTCTFNAAVYLKDFLLQDRCYIEKICSNISKCLVVYRKNGLPDADFWKNTCREFIKLFEEERL